MSEERYTEDNINYIEIVATKQEADQLAEKHIAWDSDVIYLTPKRLEALKAGNLLTFGQSEYTFILKWTDSDEGSYKIKARKDNQLSGPIGHSNVWDWGGAYLNPHFTLEEVIERCEELRAEDPDTDYVVVDSVGEVIYPVEE